MIDVNPFRTAVPFWGQTRQILSSLSPKRDCGRKRVNIAFFLPSLLLVPVLIPVSSGVAACRSFALLLCFALASERGAVLAVVARCGVGVLAP